MSKPEDHLIRTVDLESAQLALSEMTGLTRLRFELHRLSAGATYDSPQGTERFIYVLEGSGNLRAADDAVDLGSGDFAALMPAESARVDTEQGISFLLGCAGS